MAERTYDCRQISIPHTVAVELWSSGLLKLGLSEEAAVRISMHRALRPPNVSVSLAFVFWLYGSWAILIFSIYLSFARHWWWFILGFILFGLVFEANKRANAQNVTKAALYDAFYYDALRAQGLWRYRLDESYAAPFIRSADVKQVMPIKT